MNYNCEYMKIAFEEAKKAFDKDEVPIGAVIIKNNKVIAKAHNIKEYKKCSIYHAEIIAIHRACEKLGNWRLDGCEMYVTFEPCPMCASAIKQSRIGVVYSGLSNSDSKNPKLLKEIFLCDKTNPSVNFYNNLYVEKSLGLLKEFFLKKRIK